MSCNGTLSYYCKEKLAFFTVYIHHIEKNYSPEIDSLELLNKYYSKNEKALSLVNSGSLSYFTKDEIVNGENDIDTQISNSINDLCKITNLWTSSNYVYFSGHWFPSPNDVKNIYFHPNSIKNISEDYGHYDFMIDTFNFFVSKKNPYQNKNIHNTNISKVVVFSKDEKPIFVLCMNIKDIVSTSVGNQIDCIYTKIIEKYPLARNADWYDFDPNSDVCFEDYMLYNVVFDENNSPTWNKNIQWKDIAEKYYCKEGLEKLLISESTKVK